MLAVERKLICKNQHLKAAKCIFTREGISQPEQRSYRRSRKTRGTHRHSRDKHTQTDTKNPCYMKTGKAFPTMFKQTVNYLLQIKEILPVGAMLLLTPLAAVSPLPWQHPGFGWQRQGTGEGGHCSALLKQFLCYPVPALTAIYSLKCSCWQQYR